MTSKDNEKRDFKDPYAVKDFTNEWEDWLGDDTIALSTWEVPAGITKDSDAISEDDLSTVIWLSGGTANTDYNVYNTIVTAGGRTERALRIIQVR